MAPDGSAAAEAEDVAATFTVGQTVGQPTRTLADIGDPTHAPDPTLARIPTQRFCPDTEEVTGSNPVSPTSITPGQSQIPGSQTVPGAGPETVAYLTAYLSPRLSCGKRASIALAPRVSTGRSSLRWFRSDQGCNRPVGFTCLLL